MRGFYVVKNPLIKPSLSINERFSTIEGSTIEGFQCIQEITILNSISFLCNMQGLNFQLQNFVVSTDLKQ